MVRDLPVVFREALCLHDILRTAGFTTEQIFVMVARCADPVGALFGGGLKHGDLAFWVVLRAQGLEWAGLIGALPCAENEVGAEWGAAATSYNGAPKEECRVVLDATRARHLTTEILVSLLRKGFALPRTTN